MLPWREGGNRAEGDAYGDVGDRKEASVSRSKFSEMSVMAAARVTACCGPMHSTPPRMESAPPLEETAPLRWRSRSSSSDNTVAALLPSGRT